jgi:hypothetical protein
MCRTLNVENQCGAHSARRICAKEMRHVKENRGREKVKD